MKKFVCGLTLVTLIFNQLVFPIHECDGMSKQYHTELFVKKENFRL